MNYAAAAPRHATASRVVVLFLSLLLLQCLPGAEAATSAGVRFERISVSGNTAVPTASLDEITRDYLQRPLTDRDLQALLARLTGRYAELGFRTARAILPDQRLGSGILLIEIIEPKIESIEIEGNQRIEAGYLRARLGRGLGKPVDINQLNDNLRLVLLERVVEKLDASFKPGSAPDRNVLVVKVTEASPFSAGFRFANDRSPSVGGEHGQVELGARDLLGRSDEFNATVGRSDGLDALDLRLRVPLNAAGTELSARYGSYDSTLIEEQFAVLGANTESRNYEVGLLQPVWRSAQRQVALSARYSHRRSQSFLLGKPYSFSAEADDGLVEVGAARLGFQWTERLPRDILSLRLTASVGVGGTEHPGLVPDARFVSGFAQAQWLHVLGPRLGQLVLRGDVQIASEPLVSLERFAVGGASSVRGYRRSRLVNDKGWTASIEHRLPLFHLRLPGGNEDDGQLWAIAFLDAGEAWSARPGARVSPSLIAFGPGLRWDASKRIRAEFYWGAIRNRIPQTEPDLQDSGFHFMVAARIGY